MKVLTIDPSFNSLAFSIYDGNNTVYIDNCSYSLGADIGFERIFNGCNDLWCQLNNKLDLYEGVGIDGFDAIMSEFPPPVSQFSAGLYALDTTILNRLNEKYNPTKGIHIIPSGYLSTVHGTNKYSKGDSTRLAKYFIGEVLGDRFDFKYAPFNEGKRKQGMNNDRAESFLFMLRAFCKYDLKGLGDVIANEMAGLGKEAEKILIEGENI